LLIDDQSRSSRAARGLLFVVYPFDNAVELRTSAHDERSTCKLKAMDL
jgi:hypothetical protein